MTDTPRELTADEVREAFLNHVRELVLYWDEVENGQTQRRRLSGLAFSILVALDGASQLPGFAVVPQPHDDDRAFHESEGENWYPSPPCDLSDVDIAGALHEHFYTDEFKRRLAELK